jgi:hypothetical protein
MLPTLSYFSKTHSFNNKQFYNETICPWFLPINNRDAKIFRQNNREANHFHVFSTKKDFQKEKKDRGATKQKIKENIDNQTTMNR